MWRNAATQCWVAQAWGEPSGSWDFPWVGEAAEAPRSGRQAEHKRGKHGGSVPHACRLAVEYGPVNVRENDRPRRLWWAQAIAIPSGGADSVAQALPSARFSATPVLEDGPCSLARGRRSGVRRETHAAAPWPTTHPAAPFLRGGGTGRVRVPGEEPLRRRVMAGAGRETRPDVRQHRATARAQDAVRADCDAPPWQHRLEEAVEARCGGQRQTFPRRGAA